MSQNLISFFSSAPNRKKFKNGKKWAALKAEDRELIKTGCLTSVVVEPEKLGMFTLTYKIRKEKV